MRVLLTGLILAAVVTTDARAATIVVPPGNSAALIAAVNTANGTAAADTLEVSGGYSFAAADNAWYGPNALPAITTDITIAGSPTAGAVIANTTATRLRLLYVAGNRSGLTAGTLRLRNVELRDGIARGGSTGFGGGGAGLGGAIYNQGTLELDGVTFAGNQAIGGTTGPVNSNGGGGLGADANAAGDGGGFGGATPGVDAGSGGSGGAAPGGGGGGGGYGASDDGANGGSPAGGGGGGTANGLGGANRHGVRGGNGSGAGGQTEPSSGAGGAGGAFGAGGAANGGGGGVGGGGGAATSGGGSGGFGGGGGWANTNSGNGGFGGGGAGNAATTPSGKGGWGGGNGGVAPASGISLGGGGAGLGGAIFNDRGTIRGVNSTLSENRAAGGNSTTMGLAAAGAGGDAYGAAIFNLNGTLKLTHVTVASNTTVAGVGASIGAIGGTIATLGYDSASASSASTELVEAVVSANPLFDDAPATVADGAANAATRTVIKSGYIGGDPEISALGDYGGPTRTMAPFPDSPVIGAATVQNLVTADQRGIARTAPLDLGAVETAETTIAANDQTIPFSAAAHNAQLSALVTPGHGSSAPGNVLFALSGGLGSATSPIAGNSAIATLAVPANAPAGTYTITASAAATAGFGAAADTATLKILQAPQVCAAGTAFTLRGTPVTVAPSCTGAGPRTLAVTGAPAHGTVTIVGEEFRYTPTGVFTGTDTFTYAATNEGGPSNPASVTVTVGSAAPACHAVAATVGAGKGRAIAFDCASEIDQAFAIVAAPAHGTLSAVDAGTVTYTSAEDYAGSDTFTYRSTNSTGTSSAATVSIDVKARPTLIAARSHAEIAGRFDPQPGSALEFRVYPNVACTGAPVFTQAVEPDVTGVANVAFAGSGDHGWQVSYSGDANNLGATSACDPVPGTPAAAKPAARVCGDPVTLLDVLPVGKRVRVRGFAQRSFAGQTVTIQRAGKKAGTATVGTDGLFAATVSGASAASYTATLGSLRSRALRSEPQLRLTRSATKVTGLVELRRKPRTVTIVRMDACANRSTTASVRVAKSGRFTLAVGRPDAGSPYALYRVSAKLGGKTYSTQVAVTS